ncbi:MAG: DUF309 domain-containing protein [Pirellulaceae bacterium]|nr:DUF309 domain-containing protein [Thermoguttaceae bacterium]NLZ03182.1 DUF309 domain-containing protein [Pirellulaceae bacterium]
MGDSSLSGQGGKQGQDVMTGGQDHDLYVRGIARFNQADYFESHEVWEALWIGETGPSRQFFKGLIQAAVALYHLENGNETGSRKLLESSAGYLQAYRPHYSGLDVDRFLGDLRRCFEANIERRRGGPGELIDRPTIGLAAPTRGSAGR